MSFSQKFVQFLAIANFWIKFRKLLLIFLILFLLGLAIEGSVFKYKHLEELGHKFISLPEIIVDISPIQKLKVEKERKEKEITRLKEEIKEIKEKIAKIEIEKEKKKIIKKVYAISENVRARSDNVKGLYMNEFVANSSNLVAAARREKIKKLLKETELNGIVIDVKEAGGPNLPSSLKKLIEEFQGNGIWVMARIVVFRDSSLVEEKPGWYLKTKSSGELWQDKAGGHWLDPASTEVQDYIINFSKKVIDFGFDELQFDYIRFPSDGEVEDIAYPVYDQKEPKYMIIRDFSKKLLEVLKSYKPEIVLSVDLFGYVATQYVSLTIGQRLEDFADFDYISPMLYPSHFYSGFKVPEDSERELPALNLSYPAPYPYQVVYRSILSASDYFSEIGSKAKIRPWLQDFSLKVDEEKGVYYDAKKVRAQIQAAEEAGSSGWLLWNPANVYTQEALQPD